MDLYALPLKSGIYQIRVAARDENSGRVGSAMQWIEIPDLSSEQLTLSSLMIGGQFIGSTQTQATGSAPQQQVQFSVDRRFRRDRIYELPGFHFNAAKPATGNPQDHPATPAGVIKETKAVMKYDKGG